MTTNTHTPEQRTYNLAIPSLDGQDAVRAILDQAALSLVGEDLAKPTTAALFAGFELALGSILSADEAPAGALIRAALGVAA